MHLAQEKAGRSPHTQAGEKALRVLSAFSHEYPELGLAELANLLEMNRGSIYRATATLERHGFLQSVGGRRDKRYRIGLRAFQIGMLYQSGVSLTELAMPILRDLMQRSGCTAQLGVADEAEAVIVASVESSSLLRVVAGLGEHCPAHASTFGKLFLAERGERGLDQVFRDGEPQRFTSKTIVGRPALAAELERIRRVGFVVNDEEWHEGVVGLAAPVRNYAGNVVAGLGLGAPSHFVSGLRRQEVEVLIREGAERLSRVLGATDPVDRARQNGTRPGAAPHVHVKVV